MILASLCYVKKDGKTLMLHRNRRPGDMHKGKWNGLGGKMHEGETPEECVIREVEEEAGIRIRDPKLCGILTFPEFNKGVNWYAFVFTAREFSGEPFTECDEGELSWIPDGEITRLPLWEGDKYFLEWIEQGRFFSGKFVYEDGRLVSHEVRFHPFTYKSGSSL